MTGVPCRTPHSEVGKAKMEVTGVLGLHTTRWHFATRGNLGRTFTGSRKKTSFRSKTLRVGGMG